MVQILPRVKSTGEKLAGAVGDITQTLTGHFAKEHATKQEDEALARMGIDTKGLSPEIKQLVVSESLKGRGSAKGDDKFQAAQAGLETVQRMRQLGETGHLGPKVSQFAGLGFLNPNVRRDRAEYEQLGKTLIRLASGMNITNKDEFNTLAENLYDPTLTDAAREGILNALERHLKQSMGQTGVSVGGAERLPGAIKNMAPPEAKRPPIGSFGK